MRKVREITMVLLMVISLFSVLVIVNVPEVEAELNAPSWNPNGYWETPNNEWTIEEYDNISYENTNIVVNGNLLIEEDGILTLSNVTLQMNATTSDAGDKIQVDANGELNVINGSTITTDPITAAQSPDPYEFIIDGTALIENSTVEKMKDRSGTAADGIYINSLNVRISNSTIQNANGTGIYVKAGTVSITNSTIINNGDRGIHLETTSYCKIIDNNISSNNDFGIRVWISSNNTIENNIISANNQGGIHLYPPSHYNIINGNTIMSNIKHGVISSSSSYLEIKDNDIISNGYDGIDLGGSNNNNISYNNVISNGMHGISLSSSSNNILKGNNITSNEYDGVFMALCSNNKFLKNNTIISTWKLVFRHKCITICEDTGWDALCPGMGMI